MGIIMDSLILRKTQIEMAVLTWQRKLVIDADAVINILIDLYTIAAL